jgi:hypothetical protein
MAYELEEFCNDCREAIQSDPGDGGREVIRDKLAELVKNQDFVAEHCWPGRPFGNFPRRRIGRTPVIQRTARPHTGEYRKCCVRRLRFAHGLSRFVGRHESCCVPLSGGGSAARTLA